jgi:phosphoglycerate-specific signal transduction histidine kinase
MFTVILLECENSKKWFFIYFFIIVSIVVANYFDIIELKYDHITLRQTMIVFVLFMILGYYTENVKRASKIMIEMKNKELEDINNNLEKRVQEEVTLNVEREKQLIEQSKMANLGAMIGNIAHQWRQPLGMISSIANANWMKTN